MPLRPMFDEAVILSVKRGGRGADLGQRAPDRQMRLVHQSVDFEFFGGRLFHSEPKLIELNDVAALRIKASGNQPDQTQTNRGMLFPRIWTGNTAPVVGADINLVMSVQHDLDQGTPLDGPVQFGLAVTLSMPGVVEIDDQIRQRLPVSGRQAWPADGRPVPVLAVRPGPADLPDLRTHDACHIRIGTKGRAQMIAFGAASGSTLLENVEATFERELGAERRKGGKRLLASRPSSGL